MTSRNSGVRGMVVAGTHSGSGKTSLALGIMAALIRRGRTVQPFKVGPDFIDPGHHERITGRPSRNLDGWMLSRAVNRSLFRRHLQGADVAVVEGVMGLFDGYDGATEAGSTAQMAKWLGLPVLLVVDARSMSRSAAAVVLGFASFDPAVSLAGVVFNRVGSAVHLRYLEQALARVPQVRCLGGLPRDESLHIPERHLGLVTREEHEPDSRFTERLADLVEEHLDLDTLLSRLPRFTPDPAPSSPTRPSVRIGVARDPAFCFYYPDNLDLLTAFGAELVPFSPLQATSLPGNLHGLYLGGGYPELFAARLSANTSLRMEIRERARHGLPIYAECGGLMYLAQEIEDLEGNRHPMVGALPLRARMLSRRKALGYREVVLDRDCLLGPAGTRVRGHEFHYSSLLSEPPELERVYRLSPRQGGEVRREGYALRRVLASYVHLHFWSNPSVAEHFVRQCQNTKEEA